MRVLVTGSCSWKKSERVFKRLAQFPEGTTILHGCAVGVDTFADRAAKMLGFDIEEYPPEIAPGAENNKKEYGKACSARNIAMTEANPDLCLAFWNGRSHGTFHTMYNALIRGIQVEVVMEQ